MIWTWPQIRRLPSFWEQMKARFGIYQPIALGCSTFGIILASSAVSSLWFWSSNDNPESLRSKVALAGWTASVIAICSALIRVCIAVQLGTCCMMVASLAFEKNCVLMKDAATMSIYRYSAPAPYSMVFPVLRGTRVGRNFLGISLLVLLSFLAIVSQFISTILLSDTGPGNIAGRRENVSLAYSYGDVVPGPSWGTLQDKPVNFPRFAEKAAKPFHISYNSTGPGISDTGPTVRSLFPLKAPQRSSLLYYQGNATMIDSHVLCVSPTVDQLQCDYAGAGTNCAISGNFSAPILGDALASGQLERQGSFARNETRLSPIFTVEMGAGDIFQGAELIIPVIPYYGQQFRGSDDSSFPGTKLFSGDSQGKWLLLLRQTGSTSLEYLHESAKENLSLIYSEKGFKFNGTEWTTKFVTTVQSEFIAVAITLCYLKFNLATAEIEVKADSNFTEPQYSTVVRASSPWPDYNMTSLQNQLGVKTQDDQERGIFDLANYTKIKVYLVLRIPIAMQFNAFYNTRQVDMRFTHPIYGSIFSTMLNNTKTASLALQALFTLFTANYYYAELDNYNTYSNSIVQTVQPVNIPTMMRGLFIVWGIIGIHFLSVGVIFWLYFKSSAPKFLNQAWQIVGQLHSGDAREFLDDTGNLGDRAVGRLPSAAAMWEEPVKISREGKHPINYRSTSDIPLRPLQVRHASLTSQLAQLKRRTRRAGSEQAAIILDQEGAGQIPGTTGHCSSTSLLIKHNAQHTVANNKEESDLGEVGVGGNSNVTEESAYIDGKNTMRWSV